MILNRPTFVAHDLLEGYNIGVDLGKYVSDALDANPAIQSPAFVNIVRGDPNPVHGYT
jgi:hypothetical protein